MLTCRTSDLPGSSERGESDPLVVSTVTTRIRRVFSVPDDATYYILQNAPAWSHSKTHIQSRLLVSMFKGLERD